MSRSTAVAVFLFISTVAVSGLCPTETAPAWPAVNLQYQLGKLISNLAKDLQPASANVTAYGIDGFDTQQSVVAAMVSRGLKPICYFSAGSAENWRPDYHNFSASVLGKPLDGWAGERWLDIRSEEVRAVMRSRIQMCRSKGFVAVDPDNVDGYTNANGFGLTAQDQLDYNTFLATYAHSLGLLIGLKNDVDQIPQLVGSFDFAVNEECWHYNECNKYQPFLDAHKAVYNIEYVESNTQFIKHVCPKAVALGIKSMKEHLLLDSYRLPCSNA